MTQAVRASVPVVNNNSGSPLVINKPTGTVDGDTLVAFFALNTTGGNNFNTLAGWTPLYAQSSTNGTLQAFYKSAVAEPANYSWTLPSNSQVNCGLMLSITAAGVLDTSSSVFNAANNKNVFGTPITPAAASQVLVWCAMRDPVGSAGSVTVPTSYPSGSRGSVFTGSSNLSIQLICAADVYPSAAITPAGWANGSIASTPNAPSIVMMLTFADPSGGAGPLLFDYA